MVKNAINPKAGGSTDLVQLFRTITEKYPTLCSISRLITTLNSAYANAGPPSSWNLEVQNWNHLPSEVYECYLLLKITRFDPLSHLLTDAALVHPGHKNLSWLVAQKAQAHARLKEELYTIAGISDNAPANVQLMAEDDTAMIALDAFFDFDKHDAERLTADPAAMLITSKEMVDDGYLAAESTNLRVNNVMEWWSTNEGHCPNIAKMAFKVRRYSSIKCPL